MHERAQSLARRANVHLELESHAHAKGGATMKQIIMQRLGSGRLAAGNNGQTVRSASTKQAKNRYNIALSLSLTISVLETLRESAADFECRHCKGLMWEGHTRHTRGSTGCSCI